MSYRCISFPSPTLQHPVNWKDSRAGMQWLRIYWIVHEECFTLGCRDVFVFILCRLFLTLTSRLCPTCVSLILTCDWSNHRWKQTHWTLTLVKALLNLCPAAVIGAPLVEVNLLHNYMNVTIKGPFRWRTQRRKKKESLWRIFPHMIYNVSVFNSRSNHTVSAP